MYVALMAAKSFIQPKVRADLRDQPVLDAIDGAIVDYQTHKSPPPGALPPTMNWDETTEIPSG
jgi:hypothetical protein